MRKISFLNHKKLYKDKFSDDDGKMILHDLCNKFYITSPTIRKNETKEDYLVREGMRQVVLYILSNVNYDIDKYLNERQQYRMEIEHDR